MYLIVGWVNVGLVAIITSPFWLGFLNKHFIRSKSKGYGKLILRLRKLHKLLAPVLIASAFLHGYLALGSIRPHTGLIAAVAVCVVAFFGLLFYLLRKKSLFLWHKGVALALVCIIAVHLLFPNLLTLFYF